jgi:hypothetical protein
VNFADGSCSTLCGVAGLFRSNPMTGNIERGQSLRPRAIAEGVQRPYDSDLLIPAIDTHCALLGRVPRLVAADAAFYSARNGCCEGEGRKASVFPIARPKAPSANVSRKSVGSVTARRGAPDARGASVSSNGGTASAVAATRDLPE